MLVEKKIEYWKNPAVIEKAEQELNRRRGKDFNYESLVGNRKPPLDYRQR